MTSRIAFLVSVSLLWMGALAGAAAEPAASGPMSPATASPARVPNPVEAAHCQGSSSSALLNPSPELRIMLPQNCGSCGTCTQPRTQCYVFNQGWGVCNFTPYICGDGLRCECGTGGIGGGNN